MPAPTLSRIHLRSTLFLECAIFNDPVAPAFQPAVHYTIQHQVTPSFNLDDRLLIVDLLTHCTGSDEQGAPLPIGGRFHLHLTFEVENMAELLEAHPGTEQPIPNEQLTLTVISVAYSTARGMILSKTTDTILQGFTLPLLDVRTLVPPA